MKRSMKKFMATCAAVTAIAAVSSVSAMAADYTAENNSVKFTVPTADADTQMTVLVVPKDAEVTDENIYYIDQDATLADTALLKGDSLADGTYVVKVGYYKDGVFTISPEEFTVGEIKEDGVEILVGNVDGNTRITTADATAVLKHTAGAELLEGTNFTAAALCDGNKRISTADATNILKYTSGDESTPVGTVQVVTE